MEIGKSELNFFRSFPNVAVLLKDVRISDSLFTQHKKYSFTGKEVFFRVNIPRLLKKQSPVSAIELKHASVNFFTHLDGYTNTYLLKPREGVAKGHNNPKNYLREIILDQVRINFSDSIKGKFHNLFADHLSVNLKNDESQISGDCRMKLRMQRMVFNPFKGAYLKNKIVMADFPFEYNTESGKFEFDKISVRINSQPFTMSGIFDLAGESRSFSLNVSTRNAGYDFLKSLFPEKIERSLSIVKLDGKFNAVASIAGNLKGGDPLVMVKYSTAQTNMATPFMDFTDASFSGSFTNEVVKGAPRKDPNSRIGITALRAKWRGLPVNSRSIQISNLKQPELVCEIASEFPLDKLNEVMQSESLNWKQGLAKVHLVYSGPITHDASTPVFMNGNIQIHEGKLNYATRNVDIDNIKAAMHFEKSDFFLNTFRAVVFGKPVNMTAEARSLLTLINTQPNAAQVQWNIDLPELDLKPYIFLLQKKKNSDQTNRSVAGTSAKIDRVLDEGKLDVNLRVGKLQYKKFIAKDVLSRISFLQDRYVIHDGRLKHAGGSVRLNGSLVQDGRGVHRAEINSNLRAVDVQQVFEAFENFGQDGIAAANIRGKLDADIQASLQLQESGVVIPSSTKGKVKFSLKEGELIDFEPVKKIQNFVFKNRDFENIRFAELKNTLDLKGTEININNMEIQSSVLTMFVNGIYSRAGNTDLQIRLPLSNLRKRGKDFNPENVGPDAKRGTSILLRGRPGDDGNIRFKLDLFNKFSKDNKIKK